MQRSILDFYAPLPSAHGGTLRPADGAILCLYDPSLTALQPWVEAGFECHCLDPSFPRRGKRDGVHVHGVDPGEPKILRRLVRRFAGRCALALAFPPSEDLSIAGARWFRAKSAKDPQFQAKAAARVRQVYKALGELGCPFAVENPGTSALRTLWRKPDVVFHPCDYGAYLGPGAHPVHAEIPPRDAYRRATGLWTGNRFHMPRKRSVEPEWATFTCKKTGKQRRMNPVSFARRAARAARAACPRGFARALLERLVARA